MNILVVGASSFIGGHVLRFAESRGHTVTGTQYSSKLEGLLRFDLLKDSIIDILPSDFLNAEGKKAAVICSAIPKIDRCWIERDRSCMINVTNTIKLIKDLNNEGVRSCFLSSEAVFDGKRGYYDETKLPTPVNEYGRQKAELEYFILNESTDDLILRLSMIVGDDPDENHLFSQWYKLLIENKPVNCIEGQIFAPTDVKDVAKGIVMALELELKGLYNLSNPEYFQREELLRQFILEMEIDGKVIIRPQEEFNFPEKRSMKTYLDGTKLRREIGMDFTSMREVFAGFKVKSRINL